LELARDVAAEHRPPDPATRILLGVVSRPLLRRVCLAVGRVGRAATVARTVRDVTELLAAAGPRSGAPVECRVAYDHPCHLLHAQRVERAPLDVLAAVPGVSVTVVDDAAECCGGAGIYGLTHPDLGGRIGRDKVAAVRRAGCDVAATPNPGCMMQIGGGLRLEGAPEGVVHPVELLDESYRRAGLYRGGAS
ncbi:MAG: (Fe-S)-binding protein, partial [Longimicrobiales bacterium]